MGIIPSNPRSIYSPEFIQELINDGNKEAWSHVSDESYVIGTIEHSKEGMCYDVNLSYELSNSLRQLIKLMEEYNLSAKAYNIVSTNLKSIPTPAILFWDNRHFVVLEKVNKNTYYIADPSLGYLKYTYDEFEKHYSNTTIIVKPNENFEKKAQAKVGWTFVNSVFLSEKSLYIKMVVASLFMYGTTLIIPILIQYIIDASASHQVSLNLAYLFMLLTLVSLFYLLVFRLRGKSVLNLRVKVDRKLNTEIFNHLLRLPFKYFELRGK